MRRRLRVLHTADVHLEGDSGTAEAAARGDRGRRVFRGVVDRALADRVDLMLIAGDLFDHNRVPDETVDFVRSQLDRLRVPVVILPGNHDVLQPGAIYDRHDFSAGSAHVRVIRRPDGETLEFVDLDAVVWGRAMENHEPAFRPLAHLPGRDDRRWCLAMGHGFFHAEGQRPERSSPIFADEIRDAGWDYLALGHHHVRTDVSRGGVAAHYAGAPDSGSGAVDGSVLCIEFSPDGQVRVESRPLV